MPYTFPRVTMDVDNINYGDHQMKPLYKTPIPTINSSINVCSKCLEIFPTQGSLRIHSQKCEIPFVPVYSQKDFYISVIDEIGKKQSMALLSKMFIKNKTLFYELEDYEFIIVFKTEVFGYFSRQKSSGNSLSCLFVWPCFQKQGWGTILLDFSQAKALGQNEDIEELKSPERPFSKKAIFCFRKYWKYKVIGAKTIREISLKSNITVDDAIVGLELNGFDFKKWELKGEINVEKPRLLDFNVLVKE